MPYAKRRWREPVHFPNSGSRLDVRSGFGNSSAGDIVAARPSDGREHEHMNVRLADVFLGKIGAVSRGGSPRLQPRTQPQITVYPIHPNEKRDIETIRGYEISSGDKTYRIYRGDTHRHTEFSMDGINDGSLLQTYRYAIDVAALDFYANSEHNYLGGPDVEYHDFPLQQMVDNLHLPGSFVPLFAYERSIRFPNGHRNIIFAKRGVRPFPISREEFGGGFPFSSEAVTDRFANPKPVGTKELYAYLKENNGIAISHTSATSRIESSSTIARTSEKMYRSNSRTTSLALAKITTRCGCSRRTGNWLGPPLFGSRGADDSRAPSGPVLFDS